MQIPKGNGIDWRERRLISQLYRDQSVKVRLDGGDIRRGKIGRGIRQGRCLSLIIFNLYRHKLTNEALEGFGGFKIGVQVIRNVKYANKLVLLAKEVVVLHGMFDRQLEIGRRYRMKINVKKLG
jgi:hypothetical protein